MSSFDVLERQLELAKIDIPADSTQASLVLSVLHPYIPEETPPADYLPDISPASKRVVGGAMQPTLKKMLRSFDEDKAELALRIGETAGRILGKMMLAGQANFNVPFELTATGKTVGVISDGAQFGLEFGEGLVVDYGMGVNGLWAHREMVEQGAYEVTGIHKTEAEVVVLEGIRQVLGINEDSMQILDGGVGLVSDDLIEQGYEGYVDWVIASRVHAAGKEMPTAINNAYKLLREGGILLIRGPRAVKQGRSAEQQMHDALRAGFKQEDVIAHRNYQETSPRGAAEDNKIVVFRK